MYIEQLVKGNALKKEIDNLKEIIDAANTALNNSEGVTVCVKFPFYNDYVLDSNLTKQILSLLKSSSEDLLTKAESEFEKL